MPLMVWNDRLSVGVELFDNDHKKLVQMLNDLYDLLAGERGPDTLGEVLDGLVEYIQVHFKHEEDYFYRTGYPQADTHCHEHANMVLWVGEIRKRYYEGQVFGLSLSALSFLRDWLFDHIMGSDRQYMTHFRELGIR